MRVLILADKPFASRERAMLRRLEVGLADEGVRVVRGAPSTVASPPPESFADAIAYEPITLLGDWPPVRPLSRRSEMFGIGLQARTVADALERVAPASAERPIDVIHAFGDGCWRLAIEAAALTGARVAIDVWSARLIPRLPAIEKTAERRDDPVPLAWLAPNGAIHDEVRTTSARAPCVLAPWGAPAVDDPTAWSNEDSPAAIVVVSTGRNPTALQGAMEGVAEATRSDETSGLIFLDASSVQAHHGVWKRLEQLGLPERLSLIPDLESRRSLVLRADMLLMPEAYGDQRSITLDAMAAGMTVVALEDDYAEELVNDRTGVLVPAPSGRVWAEAIGDLLRDRGRARRIGREAHAFVRDRRQVSRYLGVALETYERLTRDEPIPFPGSAAAEGA